MEDFIPFVWGLGFQAAIYIIFLLLTLFFPIMSCNAALILFLLIYRHLLF